MADALAEDGSNPEVYLSTTALTPEMDVTQAFAQEYLEYYRFLPLRISDDGVQVAVWGEPNLEAIEDLEHFYGAPAALMPVSEAELQEGIRRAFAAKESVVELVKDLGAEGNAPFDGGDEGLADVRDLANQAPVVRFVNLLIREAFDATASDIHLEATREGLRVRLRIDGVLSELPAPPRALQAAVISRVKLMAELDIAERRAPQDGRIRVRLETRELDLRVSTAPTLYGESVVLRLLDRGGRPVGLDELGLAPEPLARFRLLSERAHGIVLATGPTGSGKTTTLYAALGLRNPEGEKVITVEDPVEYHLPGVTQVPVHTKGGVRFGAALRSILRQDPDVLMVGEMRDEETAAIAVQAAMTGHLVFSTLHTNDAVSALTRLIDLKVEPYMVAATVEGVLAQRLVRRICSDCREPYRPEAGVLALVSNAPVLAHTDANARASQTGFLRGRGCERCRGTGFLGRIGLFELLVMTDDTRQALLAGPDLGGLRDTAQRQGMTTLMQDGWLKVQAGITTVEEVLRVVGT
ncbi:MAG TPA: GspE/PulE family protein [Gemmatimonadales bacterium]|nr:GspE/PulE family protein [Gemmatimonadales bacterium]